jgi:hypothetical protein
VTEYLSECAQNTDVWKKYPFRMLRHKALIQCSRIAFGFSGIYDEDEANRIVDSQEKTITTAKITPPAPLLVQLTSLDQEQELEAEPSPKEQEDDYSSYYNLLEINHQDGQKLRELKKIIEEDEKLSEEEKMALVDRFIELMDDSNDES